MVTTEMQHDIRSMSVEGQLLTLSVTVVMDRIQRLSKEDRHDLFELVKELAVAATDEDRRGIRDTMIEILDGHSARLESLSLRDETEHHPKRWRNWVDWIGGTLRKARKEAKLTQEQLAEKSGLPQSHISRIESGKHSPSRITIEKIAKALGRNVTDFDCAA